MKDQYEVLRERCDGLLNKAILKLTAETVDAAVERVNADVREQRPANWAISNEPEVVLVILGITSDGQKVVYRTTGRLGTYHVVSYDDLRLRVGRMVSEAQTEYNKITQSHSGNFLCRIAYDELKHVKSLLEDLVALKSRYTFS